MLQIDIELFRDLFSERRELGLGRSNRSVQRGLLSHERNQIEMLGDFSLNLHFQGIELNRRGTKLRIESAPLPKTVALQTKKTIIVGWGNLLLGCFFRRLHVVVFIMFGDGLKKSLLESIATATT